MKTIALTAAVLILAQTATAGSLAEPKVEAPVIVAETAGSSAGAALPLFLASLVVYVALSR